MSDIEAGYHRTAPDFDPELYIDGIASSKVEARAKERGITFDEALKQLSEEYQIRAKA